ncbi:MAG: hypothetical protein Q8S55_21520 [Methylococcaceae bacterium]|nr:hypothetical protein [Methylococcaceae bacterium]
MTMTKIPDISYEIKGDVIQLEQDIGCGEIQSVVLHRVHFDLIASKLGMPSLTTTAETIKRRFEVVESRINALADAEHYRREIIERCGSGFEFCMELDAVCAIASEFVNDINEN